MGYAWRRSERVRQVGVRPRLAAHQEGVTARMQGGMRRVQLNDEGVFYVFLCEKMMDTITREFIH